MPPADAAPGGLARPRRGELLVARDPSRARPSARDSRAGAVVHGVARVVACVAQDFIDILEEHRSNCERQGKYVEAEIARARLDELRLHEETRRKEAMRSRQLAERLGVEEAHMLEFQQFNLLWDKKMAEYEENAAKLILAMKERHAAELRDFQQRLIAKASIPRHSKEYLNLRKIQEVLARQKNYVEAAKIKEKADELVRSGLALEKNEEEDEEEGEEEDDVEEEKETEDEEEGRGSRSGEREGGERNDARASECLAHPLARRLIHAFARSRSQMAYEEEKWLNQRQADMYQKEMRFKQKLKVELLALKKRIEQGKGEQKRQRQVMLERLLQRYQNVKRELEQQQRLERVRAEKILAGRKAGGGATGGASGP